MWRVSFQSNSWFRLQAKCLQSFSRVSRCPIYRKNEEYIAHMTNQEFMAFCQMVEFNGKYPNKYSLTGSWGYLVLENKFVLLC